jgi:hypothetical protein
MTLPVKRVSDWALKRRFNCGGYLRKYVSKSFTFKITWQGLPNPLHNEPLGTISQAVTLYDNNGDEVVRLHQYLRRDGTIGASGFPDPKRIYTKKRAYRIYKEATPVTRFMKAAAWIERKLARICSTLAYGKPPVKFQP